MKVEVELVARMWAPWILWVVMGGVEGCFDGHYFFGGGEVVGW